MNTEIDITNDSISDQVLSSENISVSCITPSDMSSKIASELQRTVQSFIEIRKKDMGNTLPDPNCVRHNHNLLSIYCESKVANEIIQKKAFILPDGTSKQGVGEVAAAVVKVGEKFRALKSLQLKKGDRENWASAIYHMLDRLATASGTEVGVIWKSIVAMVTDLCKVNISLAQKVKQLTGTDWLPGQAFCNLHFTLAIPEGIKTIIGKYQCLIGADKLFPKNVSFEMNIEDKLIAIQILDCWMRLTSIRWQVKPWNRYSLFTNYAEKQGLKNVGHMLHANRFGEFEERCAGGLYLAKVWVEWLKTFGDVRNQLACFLRSVTNLMEICKFLWAGAALIGVHLTAPFMSMLLEHRVTPLRLLQVLPALYNELDSYERDLTDMNICGFPSLEDFFLDPFKKATSCYGVGVCTALKEYIETTDKEMMNRYLKKICKELGLILKRQRGNQYGFGDEIDSSQDIRKNMPTDMLNDLMQTIPKVLRICLEI